MSFFDDLVIVAGVGVLAFVGYEILQVNKGVQSFTGQGSGPAAVGSAVGNAAGTAAASAITSAGNSFLLQGQDLCSLIQGWRAQGAPSLCIVANMPLIPNICVGGGDPHDWPTFRSYLKNGGFVDPGPTPPSGCW